jgi:hypothetical protein
MKAGFWRHLIPSGGAVVPAAVLLIGALTAGASGAGGPSFSASNPVVFGFVSVGSVSATRAVVVTNTGEGRLEISAVVVQDGDPHASDPHDFGITSDGCTGASLAAGQSCTVEVVFHPVVTGTRVGALQFVDNRSSCGNYVTLAGSSTSGAVTARAADCLPSAPATSPATGVAGVKAQHLGSTARCTSLRTIRVHLQTITGDRVITAIVYINRKVAEVVRGTSLRTVTVDLRGLLKARYEVLVVLDTAGGRQLKTKRAYLTCTAGKRSTHPLS